MVLADTGFFYALADRNDTYFESAKILYEKYSKQLTTTWPVVTETCHLLLSRLGPIQQEKFIQGIGEVKIFSMDKNNLPRIKNLIKKYRNLPMDLADASLVILAEEKKIADILSVDFRDFGAYRWKERKPFNNLITKI